MTLVNRGSVLLASMSQIVHVSDDIIFFFEKKVDPPNVALQNKIFYIFSTEKKPFQLTSEQIQHIEQLLSLKRKKLLRLIVFNSEFCRYAVETYTFEIFAHSHGFSPSDSVAIAILSNSILLLKDAILNSPKPGSLKINRMYNPSIQNFILDSLTESSLFIDFSSRTNGIPFINDDISCATAFTASQSEVFIGQRGGLIVALSLTPHGKPMKKYNLWKAIGDQPYSLCFVHENLYMITEKQAFEINVCTNRVLEIHNKPDTLVPPICTDGHFFYSVRILVRKGKLSIFSLRNGLFQLEKKLILKGNIADIYQELRIPFISNGIRITFATPRVKSTHFIEFSLESGTLIRDYTTNSPTVVNAWCTRPYKLEHVALTNSDVSFYRSCIQPSKWLCVVPFPTNQITLDPYSIISSALYHGAHMFRDENCSNILDLLIYFNEKQFSEGIYMCGLILIDNAPQKNIDHIIEIYVHIYYHTEEETMKLFCVYLFLYCFQFLTNPKIYKEINLLNDYVENSYNLDYIWFFPTLIDFKCMKLSKYSIDRLIPYVSRNVRIFPQESIAIMSSCCTNYIEKLIEADKFEDALIPFKAICNSILTRINYFLPNIKDPSEFINSPHFVLWKYVLKLTYRLQTQWPRFALDLLSFYQNLLIKMPDENSENKQLLIMLNRSLYLLIGIVLSAPYNSDRRFYKSIDEFYLKNPHPLHKVSKSLDKNLFKLLTIAYDVTSESMFRDLFFDIRRKFMFNIYPSKNILEKILNIPSLSSFGLMRYIVTGNINDLCSMSDVSTLGMVMKNFQKSSFKLTEQQQVVFSMYATQFADRVDDLLDIGHETVEHFINSFSFPFFFPPVILQSIKLDIQLSDFENMNDDFIIRFFDSLLVIFRQLNEIYIFVAKFLKKASKLEKFTGAAQEPLNFKASLLCLLAVMSGALIDMEEHTETIINSIIGGSPRVITVIMRIVNALDKNGCKNLDKFFEFAFFAITEYIANNRSIYITQSELYMPLQSTFVIISHLKEMFNNSQSSFNRFLESIAHNQSVENYPAVFAILNNSMEAIRSGVMIRFTDKDDIYRMGKVVSRKTNTFDIDVDGHKETFSITDCKDLWCECAVKVDLKLITDYSFYYTIFSSNTEFPSTVEIFRLASLLAFLKIPAFYSYCSQEFFDNCIMSDIINERIRPDERMHDFYYSLMVSTQSCPQIEFTGPDNNMDEIPSSVITKNCVFNEYSKRNINSGFLITLDDNITFVSSPFHPNTKFKVTFSIHPTISRTPPTFCIKMSAYSRTLDCILESPRQYATNKTGETITTFEVIYDPLTRCYSMISDNAKVDTCAISPSIAMMFLIIDLQPGMVIEYKFECDGKVYLTKENPQTSMYKMRISELNGDIPLADSCVFNSAELEMQSNYLIRCLKQLINLEILSQRNLSLPATSILNFLSSLNGTECGLPLTLNALHLEEQWNKSQVKIFQAILKMKVPISQLIEAIKSKFESLCELGFGPDSINALVVPPGVYLQVSNCYVITSNSFYEVGNNIRTLTTKTLTTFIPVTLYNSEFSNAFAQLHYVISLMIRDNNYDFSELKEMIAKESQRLCAFQKLFNNYSRLMELINPEVPQPFSKSNIWPAFLLKESTIHQRPHSYLIPALCDTICKPRETKENMLHITHDYLTCVRAKGKVTIIFEPSQSITLNDGEFLTVNNGVISVGYEKDSSLLYSSLPNIHEIAQEVLEWRPHHSHCLLASFQEGMNPEDYTMNPLSSKFSYDTARFIYEILHMIPDEQLFELIRHMIVLEVPKMSELSDIDSCKIVADSTKNSELRVKYIFQSNVCPKEMIDPDSIRVGLSIVTMDGRDTIPLLNALFAAMKTNKKKSHAIHWLKSFLRNCCTQVFFMFLEYVNGKFGPEAATWKPLFVWVSNDPGIINVQKAGGILIIGDFESKQKFIEALLSTIQSYQDSLFKY